MQTNCQTCKYIRYFFFAAAPILILLGLGPDPNGSKLAGFVTIDVGDYLAIGILVALSCLIVVRVYVEYYLPWRDENSAKDRDCGNDTSGNV